MNFSKKWAMPNHNTFDIPHINRFITDNMLEGQSIDPFANKNRIAHITNDLDPSMKCDYSMDALEFLKLWPDSSVNVVLFDPPYSSRQVAECYNKMGMSVNMETTQSSFWGNMKKEISRIVHPGGQVFCFGWNSGGIGKKYGFEMTDILLVSHGGAHNDTICTIEYKS
jgi:hypothetical protein